MYVICVTVVHNDYFRRLLYPTYLSSFETTSYTQYFTHNSSHPILAVTLPCNSVLQCGTVTTVVCLGLLHTCKVLHPSSDLQWDLTL